MYLSLPRWIVAMPLLDRSGFIDREREVGHGDEESVVDNARDQFQGRGERRRVGDRFGRAIEDVVAAVGEVGITFWPEPEIRLQAKRGNGPGGVRPAARNDFDRNWLPHAQSGNEFLR